MASCTTARNPPSLTCSLVRFTVLAIIQIPMASLPSTACPQSTLYDFYVFCDRIEELSGEKRQHPVYIDNHSGSLV
eukprot:scaffold6861_cov248-Ochromonas_danica.AAC.21